MPSEPTEQRIQTRDVKGLKYLKILEPMLERLHDVGKERDRAGNRQLHMDQYCVLVLLWLYSPIVDSLRVLQQASSLTKIQKRFGISKTSLGSLSESVRVFDPDRLKEIAKELGNQLPNVQRRQISRGDQVAKLDQLTSLGKTITDVDGSIVQVLARIAHLAWIKTGDGTPTCGYRLHTQFEILKGIPYRVDATSANPKGPADERAVLERTLEADRLYVVDRGNQKWKLFNTRCIGTQHFGRHTISAGLRGVSALRQACDLRIDMPHEKSCCVPRVAPSRLWETRYRGGEKLWTHTEYG